MPVADQLIKAFQVSKFQCYFDGDPQPYVAQVTLPAINNAIETFNNTSTGGPVEVADPWRAAPDGDGEITFEADSATILPKIMDASKIVQLNLAMAQNNLNPQLGQFLPIPINYKIGAQFWGPGLGTIGLSVKREITAKFKLFTLVMEVNLVKVINYDFVNGQYETDAASLTAALTNIFG